MRRIESKEDAILLRSQALGDLQEKLKEKVPPAEMIPSGKRNRAQNN